ncbi:7817_t:CDS:1, partial [Paraglomus occultum]
TYNGLEVQPGNLEESTIHTFNNDDLFALDKDIIYNSKDDDIEENEEEYDKQEYDEHYENEDVIPVPTTKVSEDQPTPCIVMINHNGIIQCCRKMDPKNQKKLWNLIVIGVWEVDRQAVNEVKE